MDSDDDFGAFDSAPAAVAAAPPPVGFGAFEEPATSFPTRPPDHPTPAPPDAGAPEASFGAFATAEDPAPRPTVDDDASDVRRLRGNCYGCGVALQTERADVSGYVDPDE